MAIPPGPQHRTAEHASGPTELTLAGMSVVGALPSGLYGRFIAVGPGPVALRAASDGRDDPAARLPTDAVHTGAIHPDPAHADPAHADAMHADAVQTFAAHPSGLHTVALHTFDVHAAVLQDRHAPSYRSRWLDTDAAPRSPAAPPDDGIYRGPSGTAPVNVIVFAGRIFIIGPGARAQELDGALADLGRADLAGAARGIGAHPQIDPSTGELHLVSIGQDCAHHVVAPNFQTRTTRPVDNAPGVVVDLLLTGERVVLIGDGIVGVAGRSGDARPRWVAADVAGAVNAFDDGRAVEVLSTDGALARWRFGVSGGAHVEVVDDMPQQRGLINGRVVGARPQYLWSTAAAGGTALYRHDLRSGDRATHDFGAERHPSAFTYVPDPSRASREDGGWLVGLVHNRGDETELVVFDAAAIDRGPVAAVRIPRQLPTGLRSAWVPAT